MSFADFHTTPYTASTVAVSPSANVEAQLHYEYVETPGPTFTPSGTIEGSLPLSDLFIRAADQAPSTALDLYLNYGYRTPTTVTLPNGDMKVYYPLVYDTSLDADDNLIHEFWLFFYKLFSLALQHLALEIALGTPFTAGAQSLSLLYKLTRLRKPSGAVFRQSYTKISTTALMARFACIGPLVPVASVPVPWDFDKGTMEHNAVAAYIVAQLTGFYDSFLIGFYTRMNRQATLAVLMFETSGMRPDPHLSNSSITMDKEKAEHAMSILNTVQGFVLTDSSGAEAWRLGLTAWLNYLGSQSLMVLAKAIIIDIGVPPFARALMEETGILVLPHQIFSLAAMMIYRELQRLSKSEQNNHPGAMYLPDLTQWRSFTNFITEAANDTKAPISAPFYSRNPAPKPGVALATLTRLRNRLGDMANLAEAIR